MSMPTLKPCPFCNGKAEVCELHLSNYGKIYYHVHCKTCSAMLNKEFASREEAIETWNKRATD